MALPRGIGVSGYVLSDHIRSLDWLARNADLAGKAPADLMREVLGRIEAILSIDR